MKETEPSNARTISRIKGVLRALKRGDKTVADAISSIERVVREEDTAMSRRSEA